MSYLTSFQQKNPGWFRSKDDTGVRSRHRSGTPKFVTPTAPSCIDNIIYTRQSSGRYELGCDAPMGQGCWGMHCTALGSSGWHCGECTAQHWGTPLQWRHTGRDSVSNHQPRECLLSRLIRQISKKTSKLRVIGLCAGNSPETSEFPAQRASNAENVSISWRHHAWAESDSELFNALQFDIRRLYGNKAHGMIAIMDPKQN